MIKNWLVATYKTNEVKKVESNLINQKFEYYLPKISTKNINSSPKEELLFPGYVFINSNSKNYNAIKYTRGIKSIIKFGNSYPYISQKEIEALKIMEKKSKKIPLIRQPYIGQDVLISKGSFKGSIVKICSFSSRDRVDVLLSLLGSLRKVNIHKKDLIF